MSTLQKKIKYPLVMVIWKDAESDNAWADMGEIQAWADRPAIICEIGWEIYQGKEYLVITNQVGEDGEMGNRTKIPIGWVISKKKVNLA